MLVIFLFLMVLVNNNNIACAFVTFVIFLYL